MKHCCVLLSLVFWLIAGCEAPQPDTRTPEKPSIEGLKLSDLQDDSEPVNPELIMKFRVLTYAVAADQVDKLKAVIDSLSRNEVRTANKGAFQANGFIIGTGSFEQGSSIAQKLDQLGAVRISQNSLLFPAGKKEPLSITPLRGTETIYYSKIAGSTATLTYRPGVLGWIFSARPDPRVRGTVQVRLFPASWQPGAESLRLLIGKDSIDYQPIEAGRVLVRIEEGGFLLLGPARSVPVETTLDNLLFSIHGSKPKVRFFVIVCDSVGT